MIWIRIALVLSVGLVTMGNSGKIFKHFSNINAFGPFFYRSLTHKKDKVVFTNNEFTDLNTC